MGEAPYKIAFAGLRHGHIFDLYALAGASPALEVVAACEEHAETRAEIRAKGTAAITHERIEQMLDEVDCDIAVLTDLRGFLFFSILLLRFPMLRLF